MGLIKSQYYHCIISNYTPKLLKDLAVNRRQDFTLNFVHHTFISVWSRMNISFLHEMLNTYTRRGLFEDFGDCFITFFLKKKTSTISIKIVAQTSLKKELQLVHGQVVIFWDIYHKRIGNWRYIEVETQDSVSWRFLIDIWQKNTRLIYSI